MVQARRLELHSWQVLVALILGDLKVERLVPEAGLAYVSPSDLLPLAKPYSLKVPVLPQTALLGTKCLNMSLWGHLYTQVMMQSRVSTWVLCQVKDGPRDWILPFSPPGSVRTENKATSYGHAAQVSATGFQTTFHSFPTMNQSGSLVPCSGSRIFLQRI